MKASQQPILLKKKIIILNEKEDLITKKKKRFYFHKQWLRDISSSSIYICYLQNFLKEKKYVIAKYLQGLQRRLEVLSLVS